MKFLYLMTVLTTFSGNCAPCRSSHGRSLQLKLYMPFWWRHNGHDCVSNHQSHHWLLNRLWYKGTLSLQWHDDERDGVSNHQPRDCLLNRLFRRRSKKTSKLRVTGLCAGNSPVTGEFPTQMASNAEKFPFDDFVMPRQHTCRVMWKKFAAITQLEFGGDQNQIFTVFEIRRCWYHLAELRNPHTCDYLAHLLGPVSLTIFHHNSHSTENSFSCNSIAGDHIATIFCTCHESTAVVSCAKFCSDHFITIWMREKMMKFPSHLNCDGKLISEMGPL